MRLTMQSTCGSAMSSAVSDSVLSNVCCVIFVRRKVSKFSGTLGQISLIGRSIFKSAKTPSNAGCVAVHRTTMTPYFRASSASAAVNGFRYGMGSVCTSSKMSTLLARLCSLRQRAGLLANRDSNSCTVVVAMTGASQFSAASILRYSAGFGLSEKRYSALLWCSMTFSVPKIFSNVSAFWSMMDVYGAA